MSRLLSLVLSGLFAACSTTGPLVPPPAPVGPPRGDALWRSVIGSWTGTAEDGSPTTVQVELTLSDDGNFDLSAGLVSEAYHWEVRDDLVVLLPDPDVDFGDGICFRASRVAASRLEGSWCYTSGTGDDLRCDGTWYPVTLDRD